MKAFRYICSLLIFCAAAFFTYKAIGSLTTMYTHFAILCACCGIIVFFDGGRVSNEEARKNADRVRR